jgi:hypothetical protein
MSGRSPAGDSHQAALGAASGEPAMRVGMPENVQMKAGHTRHLGAHTQKLVECIVGELLAAVA